MMQNLATATRRTCPPALPPVLSGLSINESQLLQADRKVEKIEIG
jgi:hypothetical protein